MARRLVALVFIAAALGALFVAGVHNLKARREQMQGAELKLVKDGQVPEGAPTGMDDPGAALRGKPAPAFTLKDVSGKTVSLADYKGHPVVINFWATFCGPCKLEMPWFDQLTAKYKDQGLVVLGVDQDDDMSAESVGAAAKKVGVSYPILMPSKTIEKDYHLADLLPETFYVDKNGVVVEHNLGARGKDELEANVKKAIGL